MSSDPATAIDRRTFLSVGTMATFAVAAPAGMARTAGPVAMASRREALPADWAGPATILSGDYVARLGQIRETLRNSVGREVALFLDGADATLFDIAHIDQRPHLRATVRQPAGVPA